MTAGSTQSTKQHVHQQVVEQCCDRMAVGQTNRNLQQHLQMTWRNGFVFTCICCIGLAIAVQQRPECTLAACVVTWQAMQQVLSMLHLQLCWLVVHIGVQINIWCRLMMLNTDCLADAWVKLLLDMLWCDN